MVLVYCEFQPSAHRNKRPANLMFLDDPEDKFPMPVCSVCAQVIKKNQPNAILRDRSEFEKERAAKRKEARAARLAPKGAPAAEPAAPAAEPEADAAAEPATEPAAEKHNAPQ